MLPSVSGGAVTDGGITSICSRLPVGTPTNYRTNNIVDEYSLPRGRTAPDHQVTITRHWADPLDQLRAGVPKSTAVRTKPRQGCIRSGGSWEFVATKRAPFRVRTRPDADRLMGSTRSPGGGRVRVVRVHRRERRPSRQRIVARSRKAGRFGARGDHARPPSRRRARV